MAEQKVTNPEQDKPGTSNPILKYVIIIGIVVLIIFLVRKFIKS